MCQPGKFKKVILTQSNDALSSQLQHLKSYFEEELIVSKWSSLFCHYKQLGCVFGLPCKVTRKKKKLFSLYCSQKWENLNGHISSEKHEQDNLE